MNIQFNDTYILNVIKFFVFLCILCILILKISIATLNIFSFKLKMFYVTVKKILQQYHVYDQRYEH